MSEPTGVIGELLEELTKLPGIGPKSAERIAHFLLVGRPPQRRVAGRRAAGRGRTSPALPGVLQPHRRRTVPGLPRPERDAAVDLRGRDAARRGLVRAGRDVPRAVPRARRPARPARRRGPGPADASRPLVERVQARRRRGGDPGDQPDARRRRDGPVRRRTSWPGPGSTVTRLARGLPSGSSLELANAQMLADALEGRRTF